MRLQNTNRLPPNTPAVTDRRYQHAATEMDASRYIQVLDEVLKPEELALLQARDVQEIPFDSLAETNLLRARKELTELNIRRESGRLRKQLVRLRERCARAITERYPHAAEDIACWS